MRKRRIVYLLMLATVLATIQGVFLGIEAWQGIEEGAISLEEARKIPDALWVDARSKEAYEVRHYLNALHLIEDEWNEGLDSLLVLWEPDLPIIVYCDGKGCESSRMVSMRLRSELGMETIYWLEGGWDALLEEGLEP